MKEKSKGSDNALKDIDIINDQEFVANDKTYFLEPQLSIERFRESQRLEIEISFSTTFKKHYKTLSDLKEVLNQAKFVDAAVKLRDIMEGLIRIGNKNQHHPMMRYCALILNTHEEDRKAFDEKLVDEKIADWEKEGIPVSSFFAVVLHSVSGLLGIYKEIILSTSESQKTLKQN